MVKAALEGAAEDCHTSHRIFFVRKTMGFCRGAGFEIDGLWKRLPNISFPFNPYPPKCHDNWATINVTVFWQLKQNFEIFCEKKKKAKQNNFKVKLTTQVIYNAKNI